MIKKKGVWSENRGILVQSSHGEFRDFFLFGGVLEAEAFNRLRP
jgi:hypothetical protein